VEDLAGIVNRMSKQLEHLSETVEALNGRLLPVPGEEAGRADGISVAAGHGHDPDDQQYMAGYMAALAAGMEAHETDSDKKRVLKQMVGILSK
jgi:hypothetical protein